ncbi:hypothetical protein ACF0H5_019845 [Mactra antiquata]
MNSGTLLSYNSWRIVFIVRILRQYRQEYSMAREQLLKVVTVNETCCKREEKCFALCCMVELVTAMGVYHHKAQFQTAFNEAAPVVSPRAKTALEETKLDGKRVSRYLLRVFFRKNNWRIAA